MVRVLRGKTRDEVGKKYLVAYRKTHPKRRVRLVESADGEMRIERDQASPTSRTPIRIKEETDKPAALAYGKYKAEYADDYVIVDWNEKPDSTTAAPLSGWQFKPDDSDSDMSSLHFGDPDSDDGEQGQKQKGKVDQTQKYTPPPPVDLSDLVANHKPSTVRTGGGFVF